MKHGTESWNDLAARALTMRLGEVSLAACNCTANAPELRRHDPQCSYRLLRESWHSIEELELDILNARALIATLRAILKRAADAPHDHCGRSVDNALRMIHFAKGTRAVEVLVKEIEEQLAIRISRGEFRLPVRPDGAAEPESRHQRDDH